MKILFTAIFAVLVVSALADEWDNIDYSKVVHVEDLPGFWDGRVFKPSSMARSPRIVGGAIVVPHTHPYQVVLLMAFGGGTGLCGGSVIRTNAVLTAAHCPIGSTSTQIIAGHHQFTTVEPNQQRVTSLATHYRLHASYNPSNLNNDIAMIMRTGHFALNAWVGLSTMPSSNAETFAGDTATMSGHGRISDGSTATSDVLRSVTAPIITNDLCAATYGTAVIFAGTICTSTVGGRGTCNGDSGGPLTVARAGGRWQVGIVSFVAAAGCEAGFPAGFVRVGFYLSWIFGQPPPRLE